MTNFKEFLAAFYPDDAETICLRQLPPKAAPTHILGGNKYLPKNIETARRQLVDGTAMMKALRAANKTHGLYFVVNAGGHDDKSITRFNAFFAEDDTRPIEEQRARLDGAPLPTSIRVQTKKSIHTYWMIEGDISREDWQEIQGRLIAFFGGDPTIKNPSRVMRLPSFDHVSYLPADDALAYKPVTLDQFEPSRRYSVEQMRGVFPPVPVETKGAGKATQQNASPQPRATDKVTTLASVLERQRAGESLNRPVIAPRDYSDGEIVPADAALIEGTIDRIAFQLANAASGTKNSTLFQAGLILYGLVKGGLAEEDRITGILLDAVSLAGADDGAFDLNHAQDTARAALEKVEPTSLDDLRQRQSATAHHDDDGEDDGDGKGKPSLSQTLIQLALNNAELFHDEAGNCYASLTIEKHQETHKLGSRDFKDWLAGELYRAEKRAAPGEKLSEAISVLRAKARYEGPEIETHVRIAEHGGAIYLDLADRDWRQVKITESGWEIVAGADSPIRFRRAGGTLALPEPVRGGELRELCELLNLPSGAEGEDGHGDNWALILGWLVAAFKPSNETRFAYPLLAVHGEQGSAKSTTCRLLRRLIDPNKADLRSAPRDERDLAIAAEHGRIIAFDNLTYLSESLSNALCRLATGGGFATRELYSDEGEVIFDSQRPVILNGIAEVVSKSDLLDRSILLYLPRIPKASRKLERTLDRQFKAAQPRILGALFDAVSAGLKRLAEGVELDELPRMADFYEWALACEKGLKLEANSFKGAYLRNIEKANGLAIEASPVAQAITAMIADCEGWKGTTGGLLKALNGRLEAHHEDPKRKHGWPQSPKGLGAKLKECAPNLRRSGIEVNFGERGKGGYTIDLARAIATDPPEEGKEVHQVHQVHPANRINGFEGELGGELGGKNASREVHPLSDADVPDESGELSEGELFGQVHPNVHPRNGWKQRAGELGELGEHLPLPTIPQPTPAKRRMSV